MFTVDKEYVWLAQRYALSTVNLLFLSTYYMALAINQAI